MSEDFFRVEARFRALVESPLRADLLRHLASHPAEACDVESLMATLGRMRLDVDNCLDELVNFGVVRRIGDAPPVYAFVRPRSGPVPALLDGFLRSPVVATAEEQSPSVRRFREMIGRDEKMLVVFEWIRTAAKSDIPVLIVGPAGSGKETVARAIHALSRRAREPFQTVDCGSRPDTLFAAGLRNEPRGSGGRHEGPTGRLNLAGGGTVFLERLEELPFAAQADLLGALDGKCDGRPGGQTAGAGKFRLVAATSRPLDQLVRDRRFREDLYHRVNAFAIRLPSLRERPIDVVVLANRFLARYCEARGLPADGKSLSPDALAVLQAYRWPGDVRELESTIVRAAQAAPGRVIRDTEIKLLQTQPGTGAVPPSPLPTLAEAERAHIIRVLEAVSWNKKEAARVLGISRGTLYRKIGEYRLEASPDSSRRGRG